MSHHQPGPYGQQPGPYGPPPQQPNPYAQPVQGQGQGYGYGPGPGQPGMPGIPPLYPPPVPPQGGGKGKAIAIAAGALVLVGAIVAGGMLLFKGGSHHASASNKPVGGTTPAPSTSAPATPAAKRYKLTAPDTVAGEYKKDATDPGGGFDSKDLAALRNRGVTNPQTLTAAYKTEGDKTSQKMLRFTGAWGDEVKDPEAVVDGMFRDVATGAAHDTDPSMKTELEGSPQRMTPDGIGDAVMKCQITKWTDQNTGDHPIRMPLCIWGDHSTVGAVFALDASLLVQGQDLSVEEAANRTAKLRADVRVEVG